MKPCFSCVVGAILFLSEVQPAVPAPSGREILFVSNIDSDTSKAAIALFREDEWTPDSACKDTRLPSKSGVRCQYKVSGEVRIGTEIFWAGMTVDSGEHEGMSHRGEEVVIARLTKDGGLGPIHVLKQFDKVVEDAFSAIKMRRYWTGDIDGEAGGDHELCIESVSEKGPGLFGVMELDDRGWRWFPVVRSRGITAWAVMGDRIVRRSFLDQKCPRRGYRFFVTPRRGRDSMDWRRQVQGKDRAGITIGKRRARWLSR
ncbi:MAG: hypothetical protein JKY56_18480 [Kofleriaceae bacterium]|nr:hypothetical protein [Kofleriaceae bacterium]